MKRTLICFGLTIMVFSNSGCKKQTEQASAFSTPQEAASKAKSDLLTVLASRKEVALGLQEQTIEKSQPAAPIRQFQVTFDSLASAENFIALLQNEGATIVPLVAEGSIATVVETAKTETGWKVVSLADKSLSDDLDAVRKAVGPEGEIVIYNLPYSGAKVYGVMAPGGGHPVLYTNYPGFTLKEAVPAERLLAVLKQDAAEFQRKYSEELKRQKLVR